DGTQKLSIRNVNANELVTRYNFTQSLADNVVSEARNAGSVFDLVSIEGDSDETDNTKINQITMQWVADHIEELSTADNQNQRTAKININTAPRAVLEALPSLDQQIADNII